MSNKKSEENSDPFLLRAVSLSADESDESAEDKWRIMRTRSEQRADHVGDWNVGGRRERKTEVITATGEEETRGGEMKEEKPRN